MLQHLVLICFGVMLTSICFAQQTIKVNGYVKYMQTNQFAPTTELFTDNLIHHRLNTRLYTRHGISAGVEMRNRIFYGETMKLTPDFAESVNNYDGVLPLEYIWVDETSIVANTIIDRAWLQWTKDKWEVRLGRQRINWGLNTVWNPNDWFNTFNYLDFDYEERPGADAALISFFPTAMSSLSVAYKLAEEPEDNVVALNYRFNRESYDIQVMAGSYQQDYALGLGWAGPIRQLGFKTEASAFLPQEEALKQTVAWSVATQLDYSFKNGLYVLGSYLFTSQGEDRPLPLTRFATQLPSPKLLMPSKHTGFAMTSYAFSPVLNGSLATMYAFEINWLIVFPTITYNIKENWDLDLVGQFFGAQDVDANEFSNAGNGVFARIKWSY